jgi:hypothetical protein
MLLRLMVTLGRGESSALQAMSEADCRPLREQMRYLLREAAQQRGLLPQPTKSTNDALSPSTAESAVRVGQPAHKKTDAQPVMSR